MLLSDAAGERARGLADLVRQNPYVSYATADETSAEGLRGWRLLALARPRDGEWASDERDVLTEREVVVVHDEGGANRSQVEGDAVSRGRVLKRAAVSAPRTRPGKVTAGDMADSVLAADRRWLAARPNQAESALGQLERFGALRRPLDARRSDAQRGLQGSSFAVLPRFARREAQGREEVI